MRGIHTFWIDGVQTHREIAADCLRLLGESGVLRSDMCDLEELGARRINVSQQDVAASIASDVAYACCY